MTDDPVRTEKARLKRERAQDFAAKLKSTGLTLGEFAKEVGFTRNVIYNLSIGQAPSTAEKAERLERTFQKLRKA